jgi:hypothetical protein
MLGHAKAENQAGHPLGIVFQTSAADPANAVGGKAFPVHRRNAMDQTETAWRIVHTRTEVLSYVAFEALLGSVWVAIGIGGGIPFDHNQMSMLYRILFVLFGLYVLIDIARSVARGSEVIEVELESRRIFIERRGLFHPEILEKRDIPFAEVANVKVTRKTMAAGECGCAWYELICQFRSGEKVCLGSAQDRKSAKRELEARRDFLVRYLEKAG